jgi:molybdenum cofactor biosynthesis enzyme MoaA
MKTHTFSIVVGTAACNAKCPFCVSKMTKTDACRSEVINKRRLHTACRIVEQARDGLATVLLTGKGEPLLFPVEITEYLTELGAYNFPLIDLQTNGILLKAASDQGYLSKWVGLGLTLACVSITHWEPDHSNNLMGIDRGFNFYEAVQVIHKAGLAARLNCTMTKSGCNTPHDVDTLIDRCRLEGVEQLTLREVEVPDYGPEGNAARAYAKKEKPVGFANQVRLHLEMKGATKLMELPHGAVIYDDDGQNVCVSNCLTSTTDPNDIRQVIFFPDGRIMYDWKYKGARIL